MEKKWFLKDYRYLFEGVSRILTIMKLCIFLLVLSGFQLYAVKNYGQGQRIDLSAKQMSIKNVLEIIEEKSDYFFFYNSKQLPLEQVLTINMKNKTVEEILDVVFANTGVDYTISNNQIILSKSKVEQKQSKKIKGKVTDVSGAPLPGVSITIVGTTQGVTTANDGTYAIELAEDNQSLLFSFMGMKPQEVPTQGRTEINVIMTEDNVGLDEVVVVGFGKQKRESVVGAIETIKPAEIIQPVRSLSQSIGGRLAGVIAVQRSGEPGKDDAQFWIRGISTFTGDQNPLILVDGIERPLNNVDPLEIESFSVLKDASATAVYGVRGANGVILINTRKGNDGAAKIDARFEQGFSGATKRPKFLNAYEQAMLYNEAIDATRGSSQALKFSDEALTAFRDHTDLELFPDVDWQKALMKDISLSEKLSVNISGGGKRARYFVAGSAYNQEGQYKINPGEYNWVSSSIGDFGRNVNYMRYNFRSNIDMDLSKYTTVSLGLQGNVTNNTEPGEANGSSVIYREIINTSPYAYPLTYKDGKFAVREVMYNPYLLLAQKGYVQTTGNEIRSNLTIRQDLSFLTKGLEAKVLYAYDAVNWNNAERTRQVEYYTAYGRDVDGNLLYNRYNSEAHSDYLNYTSTAWGDKTQYFESSMNYDRDFGVHSFGGLLLFNMRDYRTNTASSYISSLPNRSMGLAGRITYAYNNKYLIEANIGYNGSENFPKGQRMGVFPSIAVGWVASGEPFLQNNKVISWLKVRGSAGQVGSDAIPSTRFAYLSTIASTSGYDYFGENFNQSTSGLEEDQLGATDITWEIATKYNLGIELGLFGVLRSNIDVFYEKRENIFLQPQTSEVDGLRNPIWANLGVMDNRGFEVTAEYNKTIGDFMITGRGNFTFARNKIIEDGKYYKNSWQDAKGTRYGERLLYDAMHLFSQEEINALPDYYNQFGLNKTQLRAGDIRYKDVNDDGKISEDDRIYTSNPANPEAVYGFGATIAYKGFDLSFLFQGAVGGTAYLNAAWYFYPFQAERDPKYMGAIFEKFSERWTEENPNPHAFAPRLYVGQDPNNYRSSTWWVRDANYLRLKNLEFGYTIPENSFFTKKAVKNMRVYVSCMNLYTFSKFAKEFWDPEVGAAAYPIQASVFLGLNVTF